MPQEKVTLKKLLQIENFRDKLRLVNRQANLDYQVTHVTIMEGPDLYEWVTGGEFVLTTFYAFSQNTEIRDHAFEQLAQRISAIGIKTHRFIDKIPESIINIANKYGLPVFEVKKEVKFRELVSTINSEIQNYQTNMLIEVEQHYQKLIRASLNSDDVNNILNVFGKQIRLNCFCLNHQYQLLGMWGKPGVRKEDFNIWVSLIKMHVAEVMDTSTGYIINNLHIFDCYVRGSLIGMLVVVYDGSLPEKIRLMCQQAASFISIKMWDQYETNKNALLKMWQTVKQGEITNADELVSALERFELSKKNNYKIVLISKTHNATAIYQFLKTNIEESIFIDDDNYLVLLCQHKEFGRLHGKLSEYLKHLPQKSLIVGTADVVEARELKKYYEIALHSADALSQLGIFGIKNAEDHISYSLLWQQHTLPEYEYLCEKILFPLIKYDKLYQSNLVNTLCCTVMMDSLEHSAKKMNIHINTLRYRLRKIHEITGKSYCKLRDRYYLVMAASIQQLEKFD